MSFLRTGYWLLRWLREPYWLVWCARFKRAEGIRPTDRAVLILYW